MMTWDASRTVVDIGLVTRKFLRIVGAALALFTSFGIVLVALPLYLRDELARDAGDVGVTFGVASVGAIVVVLWPVG